MSEPIARIEFDSPLNLEGSWGWREIAPTAHSVMELFPSRAPGHSYIEWTTDRGDYENIGIWVDGARNLTDYDGVMSLPAQAVTLLESAGITVGPDFREEGE